MLFLWGENLEMLGFLVVAGGLKKLFYRFYRVKILFKLALGVGD